MGPRTNDRQNALLDELARLEAERSRLAARRTEVLVLLGELGRRAELADGVERFLEIELAGTCRLGQGAAARPFTEAERLAVHLPRTLELLSLGELYEHQAAVLLEVTRNCTEEVARAVEERVLPAAADLCPADLRSRVRTALLAVESAADTAEAEQRVLAARRRRRVWARPDLDGLGVAGALLPVEQLARWQLDLEALARSERGADRAAGVDRTDNQRKADLFAALPGMVLAQRAGRLDEAAPGASARPVRVLVNVTVPMASVLEVAVTPGRVDGMGSVSAEHVRLLLPQAALRRVAVDEETGRTLDVGPTVGPAGAVPAEARVRRTLLAMLEPVRVVDREEPQHDPSVALARLVDVRDQRCAGPGCCVPSGLTDRDHLVPWPVGPTSAANLNLYSRRCHRAKHTGWRPVLQPDGGTVWTSPLGRRYRRPPPFDPPPRLPDRLSLPPPRPFPDAEPDPEDWSVSRPEPREPAPEQPEAPGCPPDDACPF
jgi:Domain of unknown function (DUF222)